MFQLCCGKTQKYFQLLLEKNININFGRLFLIVLLTIFSFFYQLKLETFLGERMHPLYIYFVKESSHLVFFSRQENILDLQQAFSALMSLARIQSRSLGPRFRIPPLTPCILSQEIWLSTKCILSTKLTSTPREAPKPVFRIRIQMNLDSFVDPDPDF